MMKVSLRLVALVFLGGMIGTPLRAGLGMALGGQVWPVATFAVNLCGAFLLAALLEKLAAGQLNEQLRQDLRLGLGTGLLGSFTTYSALALETVTARSPLIGVAYAVVSVVLGVVGAAAGAALVRAK